MRGLGAVSAAQSFLGVNVQRVTTNDQRPRGERGRRRAQPPALDRDHAGGLELFAGGSVECVMHGDEQAMVDGMSVYAAVALRHLAPA